MKRDSLWRISVQVKPEAEEAVMALLERLFGQAASVYTSEEAKLSSVTVFTSQTHATAKREALEAGLKFIADCGLELGPGEISIGKIPREDWAESWKRYFKTLTIGSRLIIKPSWSKRRSGKNQTDVVLDPGLSFGTGQHPTTYFCLEELVRCRDENRQQSFLDIGTGSGILAIAAAKLGFCPIKAFDQDARSVAVAKANARKNRISQRITITRQDLKRLGVRSRVHYNLICANLIDDLLTAERDRIVNRLRVGGQLVLAGILVAQFGAVQRAYEDRGLHLIRSEKTDEWQSGTFELQAC